MIPPEELEDGEGNGYRHDLVVRWDDFLEKKKKKVNKNQSFTHMTGLFLFLSLPLNRTLCA